MEEDFLDICKFFGAVFRIVPVYYTTEVLTLKDPNAKIPSKRGRKPKLPPKDEKQRSPTYFFSQIRPSKCRTEESTNIDSLISGGNDILFTNIRLSNANKTALDIYIERRSPRIIALVETWSKPDDSLISLNHDFYQVYEKRRLTPGGGLAIQVDKQLNAFNYSYKDSEFLICLKILNSNGIRGGYIFLIVFYAPPKQKRIALEDLKDSIDYLKKRYTNHPILIVGDFKLRRTWKGNIRVEKGLQAFRIN